VICLIMSVLFMGLLRSPAGINPLATKAISITLPAPQTPPKIDAPTGAAELPGHTRLKDST